MNFIEAHKICYEYAGVFANNMSLYKPISALYACGVSSKKEIEDALILRFAHAILWNKFDQTEFQSIQSLLVLLDFFVDDTFARRHTEYFEIRQRAQKSALYKLFHRQQVSEAEQFLIKHTQAKVHDTSRVDVALAHIAKYKEMFITPKMKILENERKTMSWVDHYQQFMNLVISYHDEVCNFSNIPNEKSDFFLFVPCDIMREWVNDNAFGKYVWKYKDYILNFLDD